MSSKTLPQDIGIGRFEKNGGAGCVGVRGVAGLRRGVMSTGRAYHW